MITFGFRNKYSGWLRAAVAILIGAVMVAVPDHSLIFIVKLIAAVMIASGVVTLIYGIRNRHDGAFSLLTFNTVVDILIGLLLFMFPSFVAQFIIILLGIVLLVFGIFQIMALASVTSLITMGFWTYILPVLCAAGGALILFNPFGTASTLTLIAGIVVLVYGVSELIATWKMNKARKEYEIRFPSEAPQESGKASSFTYSDVKDVDYEKVDDQK